jgi:hypothetical protein
MSGEAEEPGERQPAKVPEVAEAPANAAPPQPSHLSGSGHKHHHLEFHFLDELKRRNVGRVAVLYLVRVLVDSRAGSCDFPHAGGTGLGQSARDYPDGARISGGSDLCVGL